MNVIARLSEEAPVLFEGAMGSLLMQRGLPAGTPSELFTIERPDVVAAVHREYAEAGALVAITNTFNANPIRMGQSRMAEHFVKCNCDGVRLARENVRTGGVVAASIGPCGELMAPSGTLGVEEAAAAFAEQAKIVEGEGADFLLIETMFDLSEALAALEGCRRACDLPLCVSMTFKDTPRGFYTMMGNALEDAIAGLIIAGADAVGSNCELDSTAMRRLAPRIMDLVDIPVLIKPNAGQPSLEGATPSYPETPEIFAESAAQFAQMGVAFIGGCCGTTPAFVASAARVLAGADCL